MRQLLSIVGLVGVVVVALSANQDSDRSQSKVCSVKVTGMVCGACAKTVEKAAKKIEGVRDANVSQPRGSASITYDPTKTTPEAIVMAISAKTPFNAEISRSETK